MARNPIGFGPMGIPSLQAETPPISSQPGRLPADDIGAVAQKYRLPRNIVMALKEQGDDLETRAGQIARELDAGKSIKDVVPQTIRTRATAIADLIEKEEGRPKEANVLRDFPAALGASVARVGGSIVRGVGEGISAAADLANQAVIRPIAEEMTGSTPEWLEGKAPNILAGAANAIGGENGLAGTLDSFVSEEVKQDVADFIDPKADLFNPGSWKMGQRPTVRGAIYSSIDVFGSMAPVVVAGIYGGPGAAMVVGGSMGGGFAADEAGKVIDQMASEQLPDGRSRLEAESSVYQRLVASGMPADQAREITKRRASQFAAIAASVPAALGGAATNAIVHGTVGAVARLPWAGRVGAAAGLSAIEEGAQEVAEGVSGRTAANIGAGINQPVTEGTLAEFTLGAIGGGAMGAVGGAFSRRQRDDQPNPAGDGSAGGQGAGPGSQLPGGAGSAPNISQAPPPVGPITRAAASAPDLTPQPEVEPLPPRFPDVKPGAQIVLQDPEDGRLINAVFMGEEDGVPLVRFPNAPDPVDIDPQLFNEMLDGARRAQEAEKAAGSKPGSKAPEKVQKPATRLSEAPLGPEADPVIDYFEERASVLEYDGGFTREEAEARAALATLSQIGRMSPEALSEPRIQQIEASLRRMVEGARTAGILPAEDVAQQPATPAPAPQAPQPPMESAAPSVPPAPSSSSLGMPAGQAAPEPKPSREDLLGDGPRQFGPRSRLPQPGESKDPGPIGAGATPEITERFRKNRLALGNFKKGMRVEWTNDNFDPPRIYTGVVKRIDRKSGQGTIDVLADGGVGGKGYDVSIGAANLRPEVQRTPEEKAKLQAARDLEEEKRKKRNAEIDAANAKRKAEKEAAAKAEQEKAGQEPPTGKESGDSEPQGQSAPGKGSEKKSPTGVDYPNRKLGFRYAKVDAPVNGMGDSSDASLGNLALANAKEGDVLPGVGTVAKVTDKQIQITGRDGKVKRISVDGDTFFGLARDMGALIAGAANLLPERLGSLMDMIERDPTLTYKNGIPELFDDPALRGERGQRPGRASILKPLGGAQEPAQAPEPAAEPAPEAPQPPAGQGNAEGASEAAVEPEGALDVTAKDDPAEQARNMKRVSDLMIRIWDYKPLSELNLTPEEEAYLRSLQKRGDVSIRYGGPKGEQFGLTARGRDEAEGLRNLSKYYANKAKEAAAAPTPEQIDAAAAETNPNPTPAQAEAENYKTGKLDWQGLKLSIENRKGSTRKGYDADGNETWSVEMPAHYGRILRTEGADGDHVDFYMGEATDSETVWVIDQIDPATGKFDEHKVMLGFKNKRAALKVYDAAFNDGSGPTRRGAVTEMPLSGFKEWIADSEKVKKPAGKLAEKADPKPDDRPAEGGTPATPVDLAAQATRVEQVLALFDGSAAMDGTGARYHVSAALIELNRKNAETALPHLEEAGKKLFQQFPEVAEVLGEVVEALRQTGETGESAGPGKAPKVEKIDDFGEKIGGSRKDRAAKLSAKYGEDLDRDDIRGMTLSEAIPEPNYAVLREAMVSPQALAMISLIRAHVSRKPGPDRYWRIPDWVDEVQEARDKIAKLINGDASPVDTISKNISSRIQRVYEALIEGMADVVQVEDMGAAGRAIPPVSSYVWQKFLNNEASSASELRQYIAVKLAGYKEQKASKVFDFDFHLRHDKREVGRHYYIYARKPRLVKLRTYDTQAEAREVLNDPELLAELQAEAMELKAGPPERRGENRDRIGPERRKGNVTPEQFSETFGFRGVEFGNYVKAAERQGFLNATFDAMIDLAGALGVAPKTLSLNGKLGIAFGARGWGNRGNMPAAAHYEPGYTVINLTKDSGAGSLAHEWFHAVDNHLAREMGYGQNTLLTELGGRMNYNSPDAERDRRQEISTAISTFVRALRSSSYYRRMQRLDELRTKPYWSSNEEMAARLFEAAMLERLEDRSMVSDFLVNINKSGGAYPSQREMGSGLRRAVDGVLSLISAEFNKQGGTVPEMPELVEMARSRPLRVGDTWEGIDGRKEIVGEETDTRGATVFLVKVPTREEPVRMSPENAEKIRAQDDYEMSPEGRAEREEQEERQRLAEAKRKEREEKAAAREERLREFSEYRGKIASFDAARQDRLDELVADGATIQGDTLTPAAGSTLRPFVLNGGLLQEYAAWAIARREAGGKLARPEDTVFGTPAPKPADPPAPAAAEPEAPAAPAADDLDALFDEILDEEAGAAPAGEAQQPAAPADPAPSVPAANSARLALGLDFAMAFADGTDVSNIVKARRFAQERTGREVEDKELEESIEAGLVLRAREITADARLDPSETFEAMLALYRAQPNLSTRTSTSVEQQAYSTPAPLAYLATYLARITRKLNGRIYEPTAGNGMLLMGADPKNVVANEINPDRFGVLSGIYRDALLTQGDATEIEQAVKFDRVITNPPFGKVKVDGVAKRFDIGGVKTTEVDHAIVWKALADMKDTGRAVLIIGGHQGDPSERQKGYRSDNSFRFMTKLYDAYNVVEHFTVDGKLYSRQGASWPVDVIVIDGRAKSDLPYPYVDVPALYSEWDALGERLKDGINGSLDTRPKRVGSGNAGVSGSPVGTADAGMGGGASGDADQPAGGQGQPGGVRGGVRDGQVDDGRPGNAGQAGTLSGGRGGRPAGAGGDRPAGVSGQPGADQGGSRDESGSDRGDRGDQPDGVSGDGLRIGPRSAGEAAASAAENIAGSWNDIAAGLSAIFDTDPNRLNAGLPIRDDAYAKAKPYFIAAVRKVGAAGKDIADVMRAVIRELLAANMPRRAIENMKDAITRFVAEVRDGIIPRSELEAPAKESAGGKRKERANTEAETSFQVQYKPHSGAEFAVGTLVPRNMQNAIDDALGGLAERVGDIDAFVAERLGMTRDEVTGTADKPGRFSAEQVDALALAIDNMERGGAFIIGDQTGVGKGRVVAGVLLYAMRQGKVPVFVTKQPGLFGDMVRDLRDIGATGIEDKILPSKTLRGKDAVPLSNEPGDELKSPIDRKLKEALAHMRATGKLPEGYSMFFTNYSQMQFKSGSIGEKTPRQLALDAIAPNAVIVLDESHEAGGTESRKIDKDTGQPIPTRADYFREVLRSASGVMYSSATYAKNPTVMSLYARTDLRFAFDNIDTLGETLKSGGVPLQQVMSNMLVRAGQYARRERSFEGISMNLRTLPTDIPMAERGSAMVASIFNLDRDYMVELRQAFVAKLAQEGLLGIDDNSVGERGAEQIGFANVMHNLTNQLFFALKAEAVVQQAIELHKAGQKPLIAVSNTNESILRDYVDAANIENGDPVDMPFNELFRRYLYRLRRVTLEDANRKKFHRFMSDADIAELGGADALASFKAVEREIEKADFAGLPGMPLDYVLDRMQEAGIKVGEITGRQMTSRGGKLTPRDNSDAAKKRTMNGFNVGKIDAVVLNQSGSTGFSLHARKAKDNDGKKRHMIVLQPDPNIDVFMQMLGRVHRTGQSQTPDYTIAVSDLALEKRVAANLMRKMASLNANTTAAKDSAVSLDNVTDFMNRYGDQVIAEILREDTDLSNRLNIQVGGTGAPPEGLAQKVTGRMAVLAPAEVTEIYERIEQSYREYIEALDRMGMNMLEAKTLDLDAKVVSEETLVQERGVDSLFGDAAIIQTVDVKRLGRSFTSEQVNEEFRKEVGGDVRAYMRRINEKLDSLVPGYREKMMVSLQEARDRLAKAETNAQRERAEASVSAWESKISNISTNLVRVKTEIESLRPGRPVYLNIEEEGQGISVYAVPLAINIKGLKDNPTAASSIRVRFAIADAAREVTVALSQFISTDSRFSYTEVGNVGAVQRAFDAGQSESREQRQIITGNLLSGYSQFRRGQIVMFSREDGTIDQGVLMPRTFDLQAELAARPVQFRDPRHAIDFLESGDNRLVKTTDSAVQISRLSYGAGFKISVRRQGGRPYILNPAVRAVVGDFVSGRGSGGAFEKTVRSREDLQRVMSLWIEQVGAEFQTETFKDEAREILRAAGAEMRGDGAAPDRNMTPADLRAVADAVNAELARSIPGGQIKARLVRRLVSLATGRGIEGRQTDDLIEVRAGTRYGEVGVLRHEIVHALRQEAFWGKPYGLFMQAEWRELVRMARADKALMQSVQERYPDLTGEKLMEEAVAEMYRGWMAGRDEAAPGARAFMKIRAFFQALANALRGRGFVSAAGVMEKIATGRIGGRGPQGPGGGGRRPAREKRGDSPREVIGFRRDNPGGEWLASKTRQAEEDMREAPASSYRSKGLGGATTGYLRGPIMLPVSALAGLPGAQGERRRAGDPKFDRLMADVEERGFLTDQGGNAVLVGVNHLGQAYLLEGNTRVAVAKAQGVEMIRAEVRWFNGGEDADGPMSPDRVAEIGRPDATPRPEMEMRAPAGAVRDKFKGLVGSNHWKSPGEWVSSLMTDRITAGDNSLLALVPGRALFAELGKRLPSARVYLRTKEEMDAMRNEWHAKAAEVAGKWHAMQGKDAASNEVMMDLMHRSTLSGIDPSKADTWGLRDTLLRSAEIEYSRHGEAAPDWAKAKIEAKRKREVAYGRLRDIYTSLPPEFQALYREVRDSYDALANDFDKAVESNIKNAARLALKRAEKAHRKELARIRDEKLEGTERDEAIAKADEKLAKVKKRAGMGVNTKIKALRKEFESQRLKGPYFPLARFGNYWVTVRDEDGAVISFSRFEREAQQAAHVREMEAEHPGRVSFGLMADKDNLREQVDPKFVADIETMLAGADASPELMDAIWQRYLETMPDQSIRTSKIHRKGREGWNRDALRAYTSHTFHGAHQLARLQYGMNLEESIEDAYDQARIADDPNRATALVNEMARRKDWTMNPTGAAWSAAASSLAFVWYLGISPAAALVNITQTTVVGPGLMKARFKRSTIGGIVSELSQAAKDFGKGQGTSWRDTWSVENAPDLTADEKAAIKEGYRRGTIDKTQAHDQAAVAESGVEFSPVREKWMRRIGFAFHHAERFNREITFLANYRLARKEGMDHLDAIEAAADMTWKIHFSYQNSDRPRFMQNDYMKVLTIFRQFQVNLLFRMFRDAHQSLRGASAEDRAEAKTQLIGITLSMMAHAGIKGTWGYGLLMGLLALFFPGDSDDLEEWMQDALLMEGDDPGTAAWNYAMGAVLNGVPGQITGAALTERIGSPNLWFRDLDRDLEGQDLYYHYLSELVGPIGGIGLSLFRSGQSFSDGEIVRGIEGAVPKFVRDVIRMGRYSVEGVTTRNGDPIIEDVSIKELFLQANGFTPARVAERYEINNRLKNREKRVMDERREIQHAAGDAIRSGEPIPERVMEKIRDFNRRFPEYPITGDTLRQSVQSRMRASDRNEFGIQLNPKLNERLRDDLAPALYN